MPILPEQEALELKRLESIATQKRIAYEKIDNEIFSDDGDDSEITLIPEYTKAKRELTEAVNQYNAYRAKLSLLYTF